MPMHNQSPDPIKGYQNLNNEEVEVIVMKKKGGGSRQGSAKQKFEDHNITPSAMTLADKTLDHHDLAVTILLLIIQDLADVDYDEGDSPSKKGKSGYEYQHQTMQSQTTILDARPVKQKTGHNHFSMKQASLPSLKLNVPLALTSTEIFESFSHICISQKFQIIEMDASLATAVNKEPFSFKKMFLRCIPFSSLTGD